jgi:hypothetical protein
MSKEGGSHARCERGPRNRPFWALFRLGWKDFWSNEAAYEVD